ncbi:hypothetical protein FBZ94_11268 [Bradyrhizobium sacchari]|uniref:Uncharacterized protein n=1 Tax=Bradyrhizobium sacchari TaxID=1399419 RepID=A0A560JC71_9BRAD|nr:hypothetical protein FBZ94_11268 [Bradyrhizobium sacchari]TWB68587.1 hypothetical protein FBZ95_111145 [Bradyrhizobium sacchari]
MGAFLDCFAALAMTKEGYDFTAPAVSPPTM